VAATIMLLQTSTGQPTFAVAPVRCQTAPACSCRSLKEAQVVAFASAANSKLMSMQWGVVAVYPLVSRAMRSAESIAAAAQPGMRAQAQRLEERRTGRASDQSCLRVQI